MDIRDLSNVSTVVIQTLKQILINHGVDISELDMQLKANNGEFLSDAVNLGELVDQVLVRLGSFKSMHETHVLVEIKDIREVISTASDALDGEIVSSVFKTSETPSTWFDHYKVAETNLLKAIEAGGVK